MDSPEQPPLTKEQAEALNITVPPLLFDLDELDRTYHEIQRQLAQGDSMVFLPEEVLGKPLKASSGAEFVIRWREYYKRVTGKEYPFNAKGTQNNE